MGQAINEAVVEQAADRVKEDTLIVIDPTDIRTILTRLGRWIPSADDLAPPQPQPRQLSLF